MLDRSLYFVPDRVYFWCFVLFLYPNGYNVARVIIFVP